MIIKKLPAILFIIGILVNKCIQNDHGNENLEKVVKDLSILARIVNGMALQNKFSTDSSIFEDVMAELLNTESGNTIKHLMGLTFDTSTIEQNLNLLMTKIQTIGANPVDDTSKIQQALNTLDSLKGDVPSLDSSPAVDVDGYIAKLQNLKRSGAYETDILQAVYFQNFKKCLTTLKEKVDNIPTSDAARAAIRDLLQLMTSFKTTVNNIFQYTTVLQKLLEFEGEYRVMDPILITSKKAQQYETSKNAFVDVGSKVALLKQDVANLMPIAAIHSELSTVASTLEMIGPDVKEITSGRTTTKKFTEGFGKGISELELFPKGLSSKWFKDVVASGKNTKTFEKALEHFSKISIASSTLNQNFQSLKSIDNLKEVTDRMSVLLKSLGDDGKTVSGVSDLSSSVDTVGNLIEHLTPMTVSPKFDEFEECYNNSKRISEIVGQVKTVFTNLVAVADFNALLKTSNDVKDILDGVTFIEIPDAEAVVANARSVAGFDKLLTFVSLAADTLRPLSDESFSDKTVEKSIKNAKDCSSANVLKNCLSGTGLIAALKNLETASYNMEGVNKFVNFGVNIRQVKAVDVDAVKKITVVISQMIENLKSIKKVVENKSRRRRAVVADLKKLEKAETLAIDFGKGVNTLHSMSTVLKEKEKVTSAADSSDDVNTVITSVPELQTMWTKENRDGMKTMLTEIAKLEGVAKENKDKKDIVVLGKLFEVASEIKGVKVDTKQLETLGIPALQASSSSSSVPVIQGLTGLKLNFANSKADMSAAGLSLHPLRSFFDDYFGVKRSKDEVIVVKEKGEESYISSGGIQLTTLIIIVGIVGVIVGAAVLVYLWFRKIKRKKEIISQLNDLETYRLLMFSPENKLEEHGDRKYIRAYHYLSHVGNLALFKRELKNGAYVDARTQCPTESRTMLHEAVRLGKTKFIKLLLEHGADVTLVDHNHETPIQMAKNLKKPKIVKLFQSYRNSKYLKVVPPYPDTDKYVWDAEFEVDKKEKTYLKFFEKFKSLYDPAPYGNTTTHIIVRTDIDMDYVVDETKLKYIFSGSILMSHLWMEACLKDERNLSDNKKWRVRNMVFNGEMFTTLDRIKLFLNKYEVPFLINTRLSFYNDRSTIWAGFRDVARRLNAICTTGMFPVDNQLPGTQYYNPKLGNNFAIYPKQEDGRIPALYAPYIADQRYAWFDFDDFIGFLLDFITAPEHEDEKNDLDTLAVGKLKKNAKIVGSDNKPVNMGRKKKTASTSSGMSTTGTSTTGTSMTGTTASSVSQASTVSTTKPEPPKNKKKPKQKSTKKPAKKPKKANKKKGK